MARGTFPSILDEEELKKLTKGIKTDEWTEVLGLDEAITKQLNQAKSEQMKREQAKLGSIPPLPSLDPMNQDTAKSAEWQRNNPWDPSFQGGSKEAQAKLLKEARLSDITPGYISGERMLDGGSTVFTRDNKGDLIGRGRRGMQNERGIKIMTRAERRKYDQLNPFEGPQEAALKSKIAKPQQKDIVKQNKEMADKVAELTKIKAGKETAATKKAGVGKDIGIAKGVSVNTKTGKVAVDPITLALATFAAVLNSNMKPGGGVTRTSHTGTLSGTYDPYSGVYTG